jgi:hypothetical protein
MAIEARNRTLPDWFTRIRTGQTVLPRFQRFEAWGHSNITQLFNTILQELPIGAVLILEVGNSEPFISRPLKGISKVNERVNEQLLDGQQRLTALWRGLHNNYEDRTYFLIFREEEETGKPYYVDSIARWEKEDDEELRPFWANRPKSQWERRMVPLHLCAPELEAQQEFRQWVNQAIADPAERDALTDKISLIRQLFASFNLPFLYLPVKTKPETALDVFIKMNTTAAPLTAYDIVVAQVEAGMGKSLHDMVADLKGACPSIAAYYWPEELVLSSSALLQNRIPSNATYISGTENFAKKLLENWDTLLEGAKRSVSFLEEERLFDAQRLPSEIVIPVLVALWGAAPDGLDAEGRARSILKKYLWRAFFSNRYEKSTSSRSLTDFQELRLLITDGGSIKPTIFDDELHKLPEIQELIGAGWPVRKDRLARAILAVALRNGGRDLADGGSVTRDNLAKREYHHLFPDAHLKRIGIPDDQIYHSLNCALVTWRTNRNISDKEPEHYLAERLDGTNLGIDEVKDRLASHLIPFDAMIAGDYPKFLATRAELIYAAMQKLCEGLNP